jgi:undecaprenyl-diphosphatase
MPSFIQSTILAIVEGLTEFLPISSTGHLILVSKLLGISSNLDLSQFEIFIQSGAILAVIFLYFKRLKDIELIKLTIAGFIPTAIIGLLLKDTITSLFVGSYQTTLISLFIGGIFLIFFDYKHKPKTNVSNLPTYRQAFIIGCLQTLAFIPGVSRSAATIVTGLILGLDKKTAVEYSFFLSVPTILSASALALLDYSPSQIINYSGILFWGALVSFATAIIAIKFMLRMLSDRGFTLFGIYRIALSLIYTLVIR